jgi:hypothetical protein
MPRYLPSTNVDMSFLNTFEFSRGDGTRNGNGFASSSGLSSTTSGGSADSSKNKK